MSNSTLPELPELTPVSVEPLLPTTPLPAKGTGESLVLLTRDTVLADTLASAAPDHALSVVQDETDLATRLMSDHAGVALIDTAAVAGPIDQLTERLRAQFPDLVLVVAGNAGDQASLSTQITGGAVYRFLHKPLSPQRLKLFVDAAWRRHGEELTAAAIAPAPTPATGGSPPRSIPMPIAAAIGLAVCVAIGVILWFNFRPDSQTPTPAPAGPPAQTAGSNARDEELDRLLTGAESALLAENVDEAERLVAAARAIEADNVRVAFLSAQIDRERERALLTQARQAAASGNVAGALAVLDGAAGQDGAASAIVAETRSELQQKQVDERVRGFLRQAQSRLASGALVEPAQNNARFFIESARALAPEDPGVARAHLELADRVLERARQALANGNADEADRWISAAEDAAVPAATLNLLKRESQRARMTTKAESMTRLSSLFNDRLVRGALVEPATDSAKYYLGQLAQAEADHPSTQLARQSLSARLIAAAREAAQQRDAEATRRWLAEAREIGTPAAELAAVERELATPRPAPAGASPAAATADPSTSVIPASALVRTRYIDPEYPATALSRGLDGWVDVEFTVRENGTVGDVAVSDSEPRRTFDSAALTAVRQWRFKPVERDGAVVEQRSRVRIRFSSR